MKLYFTQNDPSVNKPQYAHKYDSGMDIFAPYDIVLKPKERKFFFADVQFEIKMPFIFRILNLFGASLGVELQVRPKSGLSKKGIDITFGTIDFLYRGQIGIVIINNTRDVYVFNKNDKICQIVASPVFNKVKLTYKKNIPINTKRGSGGFGSTGK